MSSHYDFDVNKVDVTCSSSFSSSLRGRSSLSTDTDMGGRGERERGKEKERKKLADFGRYLVPFSEGGGENCPNMSTQQEGGGRGKAGKMMLASNI